MNYSSILLVVLLFLTGTTTALADDSASPKEYRDNGALYAVAITAEDGTRQVLVDTTGDGNFTPYTGSEPVPPPEWTSTR